MKFLKTMVLVLILVCNIVYPANAEEPDKFLYSREALVKALTILDVDITEDSVIRIVTANNDDQIDIFQIIDVNDNAEIVRNVIPYYENKDCMMQVNASDLVIQASTTSMQYTNTYKSVTGTAYFYRNIDNTGFYTYKPYKITGVSRSSNVSYFKVEHNAAGTSTTVGQEYYNNYVTKSNPSLGVLYSATKTHARFLNLVNGVTSFHAMKITVKYNGTTYSQEYSLPPTNGTV